MKKAVAMLILVVAAGAYFAACGGKKFKSKRSEEGHGLAVKHCQSCHQLPQPGLLDKKTWAGYVLPKMSGFFGFRYMDGGSYFEDGNVPETMPLEDWKKIISYYVQEAPEFPAARKDSIVINSGLKHFTPIIPSFHLQDPATTYVGINPALQQVYFADGTSQNLYRLNAENEIADSLRLGEGIVNVRVRQTGMEVLVMGVLHPSDEKSGSLTTVTAAAKQMAVVLDSLQRPVYIEYGYLKKDTLENMVLCEFGNNTGKLSWYENKGDNQFQKHTLRPLPGAVRTQITDLDRDGKQDIIALMAQGDEGFFVYYNQGNGKFTEQRLLQFSPSFGSNYFEMRDFNKDGYLDILATNGDNGDYPPILKAYHGIRIYLNDGANQFKETVFLPMNGVGKAMARDFDGDGDLDIAAISYFPDYERTPQESFIYWENTGSFSFQPYSFAEAAQGRWLTMDAGDLDGDGDDDIVLGNAKFAIGQVPAAMMKQWTQNAPSILILKNSSRPESASKHSDN